MTRSTEGMNPPSKSENETPDDAQPQKHVPVSEPAAPGSEPASPGPGLDDAPTDEDLKLYGGGHVTARIPIWLLVVYAVMLIWGLYYAFTYWGGLGPGLDYSVG